MAAIMLVMALTLVSGCGGAPVPGLEDFSVLLQGAPGQTVQTVALQTGANVEEWRPSLSDTLDDVKSSFKDMTDQVGEIPDEAGAAIDQPDDATHRLAARVARKVASGLNRALGFVKRDADALLNATFAEKAKLFAELNRTLTVGGKTVLGDFENASTKAISELMTKWTSLREMVHRTTDVIADALSRAGQASLGMRLDMAVTSSLMSLNSFMTKLKDANDNLGGLAQKRFKEAESSLLMVNNKLHTALGDVATFIVKYKGAFQDLIDRISGALASAQEEADIAFAIVHHNLTDVATRVRISSRELALGMHQGIARVAQSQSMAVPEWRSAAFKQGASMLLLLVAAAAGL